MKTRHYAIRSAFLIALFQCAQVASAQSLSLVHQWEIVPTGISEDGNVLVGHYNSARSAFRWTVSGGMVTLTPPAPNTLAYAMGVSLDGSVVAGHTSQENLVTTRGMRWTQAGGMVAFGPQLNQQFMSVDGVDGSGQTVFGTLANPQNGGVHHGYTWNLSQPNPVFLPILPGGFEARVVAMAPNVAQSKVGNEYYSPPQQPIFIRPLLWENNNTLYPLPTVWQGSNTVTCISDDGAIMYGFNNYDQTHTQPIGWRREGSTLINFWYLGFPYLGNRTHASIADCTAAGTLFDGSVIVGVQYSQIGVDDVAYMFGYSSGGTNDLNVWLPTVGVAIPPGVTLRDARGISQDGTAIFGKASTPSGTAAYVARGIPCLNIPKLPFESNGYSACQGQTAQLTLASTFPYIGTVYYQWYKDNQPISDGLTPNGGIYFGTQSSTLTVQNAMPGDSGSYYVQAYNACGQDMSVAQSLTVHGYPLAAAPAPPEVCPGGTVSIGMFTSNVTSFLWEYYHSPLSMWFALSDGPFFDFTSGFSANISGATTDTLTLSNTYLGYPTPIRFSGGNPCQIMAPIETVLNYPALPTITDQPVTTSCCKGQPSSFTVGANSQLPLTYQWQLYHTGLLQWINLNDGFYVGGATGFSGTIAGSLTPTLTFTTATIGTVAPNQPFRCIVSHGCGSVTSQVANLYICPGDVNCDGSVDFFDYLDFVDAFSNTDPIGDFNEDGFIDFFDYLDFVDAFSLGC